MFTEVVIFVTTRLNVILANKKRMERKKEKEKKTKKKPHLNATALMFKFIAYRRRHTSPRMILI